jgi:hypothetical protein
MCAFEGDKSGLLEQTVREKVVQYSRQKALFISATFLLSCKVFSCLLEYSTYYLQNNQ